MPRVSTQLLRKARNIDPLLCLLIRETRDLDSARNELRWLRESKVNTDLAGQTVSKPTSSKICLHRMCVERSRGKPLQYILGSQPFGDLDILCKPGVLIPRRDTESYTLHLGRVLVKNITRTKIRDHLPPVFKVVEPCTGTGCVILLLCRLLAGQLPNTQFTGFDTSQKAVTLARENLARLRSEFLETRAVGVDLFRFDLFNCSDDNEERADVVICNPPYVSVQDHWGTTARSVRIYEPIDALVPHTYECPDGRMRMKLHHEESMPTTMTFYTRLLKMAVDWRARLLLVEVGDLQQALEVIAKMYHSYNGHFEGVEIWHDDILEHPDKTETMEASEGCVPAQYTKYGGLSGANARAVVFWKKEGRQWLGRS